MWMKRENEARFLHQNEVNFAQQGNKMAANLDLFGMHLHRQPNANTKLDLRSSLSTAINFGMTDPQTFASWANTCLKQQQQNK